MIGKNESQKNVIETLECIKAHIATCEMYLKSDKWEPNPDDKLLHDMNFAVLECDLGDLKILLGFKRPPAVQYTIVKLKDGREMKIGVNIHREVLEVDGEETTWIRNE